MKQLIPHRIKHLFAFCLLLGLTVPWAQAQFSFPVYEGFAYSSGERIGTAGNSITNWTIGNSAGTGSAVTTNTPTLSFPGMPAPTGNILWYSPTTPSSGRNRAAVFTTQTLSAGNPTVYMSFLLNVQANPSGLKQIFSLSPATTGSGPSTPMTIFLTTDGKLAIGKNSTTAAGATMGTALSAGTHLVVVRYSFVSGSANDDFALWVDPGSLGAVEGSVPGATINTASGSDAATISSLWVVHQTTPNPPGSFYVDEIRIASTWAAVTPSSCSPGTSFAVTGGGAICSGDPGLSVGLANSEIGLDYYLRRGGADVGSPLPGTGAALDFGLQNVAGTYTVLASNTATLCIGSMTGNAVITVNASPSIGTQPSAQNPALGGSTSFTVVASGAGLTYQWRRDGTNISNGGNISGATTATLTINPVALSDDATSLDGYDVVVSGTCPPSVTSSRVALTVVIPRNLTWVGDNTLNKWDTATANWTGEATTFQANDNVTFNDTGSVSPAVDLTGVISPNAITVTGSQNYTIGSTTGGSLGGVATLTKSGSGTLTMGTVNSFTGKTTVNGGAISLPTASYLGAAPASFTADQLTLNGGAIQYTASGSIAANRGVTLGASGGTFDIPTGINFTNTPVITGPGALTKINTGLLALTVAHTYAGGTVISNGTLVIQNAGALGTGGATLAGGTLAIPATTTLTNDVSVVSDSTLSFASTANNAVVLNGNLTGSSGKTLTVTPTGAATTATRVRLNNGLTNSFTFNPNLVLNGTFTFATYNNDGDQIYNGVISGAGTVGRRSPLAGVAGRTILNGDNTYTGGTVIADGAIGFGIDSTGSPVVTSGPIGTGALTLENNPNTLHRLFASGGARSVGNAITWPAGANQDLTIEGSDALTLNGAMDLGAGTRVIACNNSANTTLGGVLSNGGLVKTGAGVLLVNGLNTFAGGTTVSNGTLAGIGTFASALTVETAGNLAPGTAGIGTLTVNGDLTLKGNTSVDINKTAGTQDLVTGIGTATYGGTLTINNLAGTLTGGESFTLFSATTHTGAFSAFSPATPGAGLNWSFTNGVLSVVTAAVAQPTLGYSQSGSTLTLSWTGSFKLQSQTNSLTTGLSGNWSDYPGGGSSPVNITIDPANPSVFFRLVTP
ncbi:MAG: autotransporter-associated beta strand repeat-containing protein [Verrucomicrobiota bacterium]